MAPLSPSKIGRLRSLRRGGMSVREIQGKENISRETIYKYTSNIHDLRIGHAYKAPPAERHTVTRTYPDGVIRSVTSDTVARAEEVCNWPSIGEVAAKIVAKATINRLGPKAEHSTKETGREGASNTDPALTETDLMRRSSNGC